MAVSVVAMQHNARVYRFGEYELDLNCWVLRRRGEPQKIEPKAFDFLAYLVRNRHRVVPKEELLRVIWHGLVVSEGALNQCAFVARKAVGDTGSRQQIIATVSKRGYRFVALVHESNGEPCPED
jgi:DNA-binding winged helix-turn-helix (wHTH) protein